MLQYPLAIYPEDDRSRCKTGSVTPETNLYSPLANLTRADMLRKRNKAVRIALEGDKVNNPGCALRSDREARHRST